jgi:FixJ family two-component response regulator
MSKIIYIIDDKPDELASLFLLLQKLDPSWQVKAYSQPELLLEEARKCRPHLIPADDFMPAMRSSELLDRARRSCPRRCAFSSRATS